MWTEPHHSKDGGSFQLMRLRDGNFALISVGLTTVKVFVTPERTDMARCRELKDFPLHNDLERVQWSAQEANKLSHFVFHFINIPSHFSIGLTKTLADP
jgi:hypothetical protein